MKVLISGGTGFIGSRLALRSQEMGHSVTVLGQANNAFEERNNKILEGRGIDVKLVSINAQDRIRYSVQGCDVVFHLAAAQHEANVSDKHFWNVNVEGTKNILEACIAGGVGRFVHGSTIGVYGSALQGQLDEDSAMKPDNIYGVTKREAEQVVLSYADKVPVVIIRISETYGPGDRRLLKLFQAARKELFFVIGNGKNKHQPIFIDDLTAGLWLAATRPQATGNVFVLPGKEVITTDNMIATIAQQMGSKPPNFHAPMWPFLALAIILESTLSPFGIQPPLHRRRLDFFRKSFYFSHEHAAKTLGFVASVDFATGIAETAKWYKEKGYL